MDDNMLGSARYYKNDKANCSDDVGFIGLFILLFHTCQRQETNILSPEGLRMSNSAVYY